MWEKLFNIWFSTTVGTSDLHFLLFNSSLCQQIFFKTVCLSLQILVLGLQLSECVPCSLNSSQQVFFLTTYCFILEKDIWSLLGHKHAVNLPGPLDWHLVLIWKFVHFLLFLKLYFPFSLLQLFWKETSKSYMNPFTTKFGNSQERFKLGHFPRRYEFNLSYSIINHTELFSIACTSILTFNCFVLYILYLKIFVVK